MCASIQVWLWNVVNTQNSRGKWVQVYRFDYEMYLILPKLAIFTPMLSSTQNVLTITKAVGESRVPVSRPKASSPGRKKLMLDTWKYKIFALFLWKLELPMISDFPYSCRNCLANHRAPYLACGDRDISGYIIA